MPFTFMLQQIRERADDTGLVGRVTSGGYSGPEALLLRARDGREIRTVAHGHFLECPEGWPVLPTHRTILTIYVPRLPGDFIPEQVTGLGTSTEAGERIDSTHFLHEPQFWITMLLVHCPPTELDYVGEDFFGLPPESSDAWYLEEIEQPLKAGRSLCIRVPLPGRRYVEFEMAGGVEYQDRIWIGREDSARRVLLGYQSGHSSLPALRAEETFDLVESSGLASLLWCFGTYFPIDAAEETEGWVHSLFDQLPGLKPGAADRLTAAFIEQFYGEPVWTEDPALGWISASAYSQRNPQSTMSVLTPEDFVFIREFFRE
jgi:hypothetical protein